VIRKLAASWWYDERGRGRGVSAEAIPPRSFLINPRRVQGEDGVGLKAQSAFEEEAFYAPRFTGQPDPFEIFPCPKEYHSLYPLEGRALAEMSDLARKLDMIWYPAFFPMTMTSAAGAAIRLKPTRLISTAATKMASFVLNFMFFSFQSMFSIHIT